MKAKIESFQNDLNQEAKALWALLERHKYQGEFPKRAQQDLQIMTDLLHECTTLMNQADKLGNGVTQESLSFLMPARERLGDRVNQWGEWIENLKKEIHAKKAQALSDTDE